jgi:hypothetical protein
MVGSPWGLKQQVAQARAMKQIEQGEQIEPSIAVHLCYLLKNLCFRALNRSPCKSKENRNQ